MTIKPINQVDIPALQKVLDDTGLFPSEMLPEMLQDQASIWFAIFQESQAVGLCFADPEPLTDGTWNMRAIAIAPDQQGQGLGAALMSRLEIELRDKQARVLIVDTSGTDDFKPARAFYAANGYVEAARLKDYWAAGDDKVIFWKSLV